MKNTANCVAMNASMSRITLQMALITIILMLIYSPIITAYDPDYVIQELEYELNGPSEEDNNPSETEGNQDSDEDQKATGDQPNIENTKKDGIIPNSNKLDPTGKPSAIHVIKAKKGQNYGNGLTGLKDGTVRDANGNIYVMLLKPNGQKDLIPLSKFKDLYPNIQLEKLRATGNIPNKIGNKPVLPTKLQRYEKNIFKMPNIRKYYEDVED